MFSGLAFVHEDAMFWSWGKCLEVLCNKVEQKAIEISQMLLMWDRLTELNKLTAV